jgi:hypothetical protein
MKPLEFLPANHIGAISPSAGTPAAKVRQNLLKFYKLLQNLEFSHRVILSEAKNLVISIC